MAGHQIREKGIAELNARKQCEVISFVFTVCGNN